MSSPHAYVYDAVRTPRGIGKKTGSLHEVRPITLISDVIEAAIARSPDMDARTIDDLVLGVVSPVGEQGSDIAKTAAIVSGLPDSVPGVQLNRFCASGLDAVNLAAQRVRSGWESLILAGGVEVMSRVPMGSDGGAWAIDPETSFQTSMIPQGIGADLIATIQGWSREDLDAFAVESHARAARAMASGAFERSIIPVRDRNGLVILAQDELVRPGTTVEGLAGIRPSFAVMGASMGYNAVALEKYSSVPAINHVHHAGNSSGLADGAAIVVVGSEEAGRANGLTPRARILSTAVTGTEPTIMLTGPAPATRKALAAAGLDVSDIDLFEVNEAFASAVMLFMKELSVPHDVVNVNGGAIAMGHPLGATGAMLLGTVIDELERRDQRYGVVTLCAGGGIGIATVVERVR